MVKESRLERLNALRANPPNWLHLCNICLIALFLAGLFIAFILNNTQAVTIFGLGFIISLSLEVWVSCSNSKH